MKLNLEWALAEANKKVARNVTMGQRPPVHKKSPYGEIVRLETTRRDSVPNKVFTRRGGVSSLYYGD